MLLLRPFLLPSTNVYDVQLLGKYTPPFLLHKSNVRVGVITHVNVTPDPTRLSIFPRYKPECLCAALSTPRQKFTD